jgi:RNA polymerase sigma-70 factor, ECF subfamily
VVAVQRAMVTEGFASTTSVPLTDQMLIEAAKMGDAGAFEQLLEHQQRLCLSIAYSILRNRDDAEDEVQNACVKAWTHLDGYQGDGSFGGWFTRIVINQCLMRLRLRKPFVSVDDVIESDDSFHLEVIDQRDLPEEQVGDHEVTRAITQEIRRLPPLLRTVLVMRDLRQLPITDVAAHLGISVAATKSRLMRARFELKQRMMKHIGANGCGTLVQRSSRSRAAYVRVC